MFSHVARWKSTDASEEHVGCALSVGRFSHVWSRQQAEQRLAYSLTLKIVTTHYYAKSVHFYHITRRRGSVVGKVTGYRLNDRGVGVWVPVESRIFSSPRRPNRSSSSPNLLFNRYRGPFPGVKRPGREADHSTPASAEVNKIWIYTSTSLYAFIA
jgi:hypothetical protein